MIPHRLVPLICLLFVVLNQQGCSVFDRRTTMNSPCSPSEIQVERGREIMLLDGAGWVVGIPSKIMYWNARVDSHNISNYTEEEIRGYMASNGLYDTKVRLNQYAPLDEWRRLTQNKQVGAGWRYTFGTLHTLGYTILPGRLFGGDSYNPYTNSVHVYSDVPSLALVNAAYSKDVNSRQYPGTYAASQDFPGVNMIHESITLDDVLTYYESNAILEELQEADEVLYPRYGYVLGGTVSDFFGSRQFLGFQLAGLLGGHAFGRYQSSLLDHQEITRTSFQPDRQRP